MRLPRPFARQTPPADQQQPKPTTGGPVGASGRFHTGGFLDLEELNRDLQHPHGHHIYDRMWRTDPDVRRSMAMILNPILGATWTVEPYGGENATPNDIKVAEFVHWALFEHLSPALVGHLAEALPLVARSGFAPFEELWHATTYQGKQVLVPTKLSARLPRSIHRWIQTPMEDLDSIEQYVPHLGQFVPLPARDLVYYRVGAEGDNWEGTSLLRPVYKPWYFKDTLERIDAIAQELEGTGLPVVYPPAATDTEDPILDDLEERLAMIRAGEQAYLIMPGPHASDLGPDAAGQGWRFEILGRGVGSQGRDAQGSLNYHADKIAAGMVAEFIRLGHSAGQSGSRATAQVQQDPFLIAIEGFAGSVIEDTLNGGGPGQPIGLVPRIAYVNFPNLDGPPKLSMSLVNSTSLTELAAYTQALYNARVLHPDDELEDYLRDKADMPPADAAARDARHVAEQKAADTAQKAAEKALTDPPPPAPGQPPPPGQPPTPAKPGQATPPPSPKATVPKPPLKKPPTSGKPTPAATASRQTRPLRHWEEPVQFDTIEQAIDGARARFQDDAGPAARAAARTIAERVAAGKDTPTAPPADLVVALRGVLGDLYATGRTTVADELARQADTPGPEHYARAAAMRAMTRRARIAAQHVVNVIHRAAVALDLTGPRTQAELQAAAEKAAGGGLRAEAIVHAAAALNLGRSDEADANAKRIRGARYTSLLDSAACERCVAADDNVLRTLDDPVRLARRPPNADCMGGDRCRCLEVFELKTETPATAERPKTG